MRLLSEHKGATLIEMIFYIFLLILLVFTVVRTTISITASYRTMKTAAAIEMGAETALDRMLREIRDATSVDLAQSTLGSSPGQLMVHTTDSSGNATTVQFYLTNQTLRIKEAGLDVGPLSPESVRVTNLVFRRIVTSKSEAVKIEMTIESGADQNYHSKPFYGTAVLRGSYPTQ